MLAGRRAASKHPERSRTCRRANLPVLQLSDALKKVAAAQRSATSLAPAALFQLKALKY